MNCGVYRILNVVSGEFYIGSSENIRRRKGAHLNAIRRGDHANERLLRAFGKYGEHSFVFETLLLCLPDELLASESRLIAEMCPVYNLAPVAGSTRGTKRSEQFRERLSEAMLGNKRAVGRVVNQAHMSRMLGNTYSLGRLHSEEFKVKAQQRMLGNKFALGAKHSDEARMAKSERMTKIWAARKAAATLTQPL